MIPQNELDTLRRTADLEQVAGEHVALKRAGHATVKGLCPFHDERTPSFYVRRTSDGWYFHCFGCGEKGDVITFVQRIEGESFPWAARSLADRFNVTLTESEADETDRQARSRRSRAREANEAAADYFATQLHSPEGAAAREFLTQKGFDPTAMCEQFGAGYAPRHTDSLLNHLRNQGFTLEEVEDAGLSSRSNQGHRSRFRGRLMWTIRDSFGKAIGFGARRLRDDDPLPAKFINTAETEIYRKSDVLWMLHRARREITRRKQAIVVEGYTDVTAMHLAGASNTVATCGTSFTSEHLATLRRLVGPTGEIVFAFDDDKAGRKAAIQVYDMARKQLRRLSALPAAAGMDPNDVRQAKGDGGLTSLLESRITLVESVINSTIQGLPQKTPEDRAAALDAVLPVLDHVSDPLVRTQHAHSIATRLGFDSGNVARRVRRRPTDDQNSLNAAEILSAERQQCGNEERDVVQALVLDRGVAKFMAPGLESLLTTNQALRIHAAVMKALGLPIDQPWPLHVLGSCPEEDRPLLDGLLRLATPVPPDRMSDYATEIIAILRRRSAQQQEAALRRDLAHAGNTESRELALAALVRQRRDKVTR